MAEIEVPAPSDDLREEIEEFQSHLVQTMVSEMRGAHIEHEGRTSAGVVPRTTFFAGALVPEDPDPDIKESIESRVSPSKIGLIGNVVPGTGGKIPVEISVSFSLYYRVTPCPSEVKDAEGIPPVFKKREIEEIAVKTTLPARKGDSDYEEQLAEAEDDIETAVGTRVQEVVRNIRNDDFLYGKVNESTLEKLLEEYEDDEEFAAEISDRASGRPEKYVPQPNVGVEIQLTESAGSQSGATSTSDPEGAVIRIDLQNDTKISSDDDHGEIDRGLYEAQLRLRPQADAELASIQFEELPNNFRYESAVPGHGFNCTVENEDENDPGDGIKTVTVPTYQQPYFEHRSLPEEAEPEFSTLAEDPVPTLENIADRMQSWGKDKWGEQLTEILKSSDIGLNTLTETQNTFHDVDEFLNSVFDPRVDGTLDVEETSIDDESIEMVLRTIGQYRDEIQRFVNGIELLRENETASTLFKQTNQVFLKKVQPTSGDPDEEPEYESWRPFQIVFIVSSLPDLVTGVPEYRTDPSVPDDRREAVNLIHFPTGGGKTEAYLALVVFAGLLDRRHGKDFGLTAMMRFPLRLLSLQQFHRVVEVLVHADELRKEAGYGGEPFSAGYYSGATENNIHSLIDSEFGNYPGFPSEERYYEKNTDLLNRLASRWEKGELTSINPDDYQMVERCPLCGCEVEVSVNREEARVEHRCSAPESECSRGQLNIHVTDRDIYAHLPTMVLGTQDKLAAMGYQYRSRTLFGHVDHKCPVHGYTYRDQCLKTEFCSVDGQGGVGNDSNDLEPVTPTRPAPALTIQDELHLINEDLGTFESHYYSAFEKHLEWACEDSEAEYIEPKKVAATATIAGYKHQIKHLYLKGKENALLFPARGPNYRETFYASQNKDQTQRTYIGVVPWNRTQINSIMRILEQQQRYLQELLRNPDEALQNEFDFDALDDTEEFVKLVTHYYAMVTYVISRDEGGRIYKSTDNQVNDNLTPEFEEVTRDQITGGTNFRDIARILDQFERLAEDDENGLTHEDVAGLIVATASISHGVDLETLNWMLFFDAPPRMSEYIQASSRVGRKYPGIILDVFNPIKNRDRSHYHYFEKYHEYMDRLVQPVPLNRWAKFSIKRSLPGLLKSLFLVKYQDEIREEKQSYFSSNIDRSEMSNVIGDVVDRQQCIEDLKEIYGEGLDTPGCPFDEQIENLVNKSFSNIETDSQSSTVEDAIVGHKMNSLREVDEQVDIQLTSDERDALNELR